MEVLLQGVQAILQQSRYMGGLLSCWHICDRRLLRLGRAQQNNYTVQNMICKTGRIALFLRASYSSQDLLQVDVDLRLSCRALE